MKPSEILPGAMMAAAKKEPEKKEEKHPKKHGRVMHAHISRAENGYTIRHEHEVEPGQPADETNHIASNQDELVEHILEHLGEKNDGEDDADAGKNGISEEKGK